MNIVLIFATLFLTCGSLRSSTEDESKPEVLSESLTPPAEMSIDGIALKALAVIGGFSAVLIVLFITVRSLLDLAVAVGLCPRSLSRWLNRGERDRFASYIEEVGLVHKKKHVCAMTFWLDRTHLLPHKTHTEIKDQFLEIAKKAVDEFKDEVTVGDKAQVKTKLYLNLRRAFCHDEALGDLTHLMVAFIRLTLGEMDKHEISCVISRKSGLDLLGFFVAGLLKVPFVLFHDSRSVNREFDFEYMPEGDSAKRGDAIIVDDSCVGGDGILEMATQWTSASQRGQKFVHAFVFFVRTDSTSQIQTLLRDKHVLLHSLCRFDAGDLSTLKKSGPKKLKPECFFDPIAEWRKFDGIEHPNEGPLDTPSTVDATVEAARQASV